MAFDWLRFFQAHRIEYSETGANTSRGNVVIHCPFCGTADPSMHMSVNVEGRGYKCWRSPTHRGRNPTRLVSALLNCSFERAMQITGQSIHIPSDFLERVRGTMTPRKVEKRSGLPLPKEFKNFPDHLPSSRPYRRYLTDDRGFTPRQIDRVLPKWGVQYCTRGAYRGRIIFPVRYNRDLVSWTGRTIYPNQDLRYRALTTDPERAKEEGYQPALGAISHYLLWFDDLMKCDADTLIICEGPFDALKINTLGRKHGIVATCVFTSAPTDEQFSLLHLLLPRFKHRYTLFDRGTITTAMRTTNRLSVLGVIPATLPRGLKDPGEFTFSTFGRFMLTM